MLSPSASAYFHFWRYLNRAGTQTAVHKFDVSALPNKTLFYYIHDHGSQTLAANDSLAGVLSQVRAAARVWNDVESSDVRLQFGGFVQPGAAQSGPGIDVVFTDDLPPGLWAQGGITSVGDQVNAPSGAFLPITRSVILIHRNLTERPSFSESFFLTVVHEFGHALGLQHTLTSSVMSTSLTRAATKAKPLTADDVAGISLLYPARGFPQSFGSISGRVSLSGTGVHLASVVALPTSGPAISAMTNADGAFRIDGVPAGQYFVYAHPLPPAFSGEATPANIVYPVGSDGRPVAPGSAFDTVFFPGRRDPSVPVTVTAGSNTENINFQVQRRNNVAVSSVQTFGFIGQVTIKPPTFNRNSGRGLLVAAGSGLLTTAGAVTPGLAVTAVGSGVSLLAAPRLYQFAPQFVQLDLGLAPNTAEGAQHLIFSAANDIYVLPSAFQVTNRLPPSVTAVASTVDAAGNRVLAVSGTNLSADTRVLFDGHAAALRSFDEQNNRLLVVPPPAAAGHRASVVALNADGQSSLFSQGSNVTSYTYEPAEAPVLSLSPAILTAGAESMVEITGSGLNLIDGLARLGFGTSEIVVRRIWVTGPNRLLANIAVSSAASPGTVTASLINGLEVFTLPAPVQVQPFNPRQLMLFSVAINPLTGLSSLQSGSLATLLAGNLPAGTTAAGVSLTLNDLPVAVAGLNNGQITFQIPLGMPSGPAVVRLRAGTETASPIVIQIDPPPPAVIAIQSSGAPVDLTRPARPGDTLTLVVGGLTTEAFTGSVNPLGVTITVAGTEHSPQEITRAAQAGQFQVSFTLKDSVAAGNHALTIAQDGRISAAATLIVR
jgi:uncharacterized protein (TIGR03437 family)